MVRRWAVGVVAIAVAVIALVGVVAVHDETTRRVEFESPKDGATVTSPVRLQLAATGLRIEPPGPIHKRAGHFHVMVDRDCFKEGAFVEMHTVGFEHVGGGASELLLDLPPGRHDLCLQLGDGAHVTLAPTDRISITVRE